VSTRPPQGALVGYQGHYAGAVTRFVAYSIDLVVSTAVFALVLAAISWPSSSSSGSSCTSAIAGR